ATSQSLTVPGLPVASRVPSELKATTQDSTRSCLSSPVVASQTRTIAPSVYEANHRPSGLYATLGNSESPLRGLKRTSRPLVTSQTRTWAWGSLPPEIRRRPSGLKATLQTTLVCPRNVRITCPVAASHTRTVLS